MDSRDEKLTLENVDEQIEQQLARLQGPLPANRDSLTQLVSNLKEVYEEKRRLEQVWERINSRASALNLEPTLTQEEQPTLQQTAQNGGFQAIPQRSERRPRLPRRRRWRDIGIGLAAALLLLAIAAYSVWAYALHNPQTAGPQPVAKTTTPHGNKLNMKEYDGQYFKIQYPTGWAITRATSESSSSSLQTVQFRPSATSAVEVNVDAMPATSYSGDQLLRMDADVKLGQLLSTRTVIYHGISWTVGIIELGGSPQDPAGKLEIAYSNKEYPYRIEFGATPALFETYSSIFTDMFASFYPQARTAATPTVTPSPTAAQPSPTSTVSGVKMYSDHYFSIQYPATWVMTGVTADSTYVETVQFRPSATSPIYVDVNVMHSSDLSAELLLLTDPDVGLGTLLNTSNATYHGLLWAIGSVNLIAATAAQSSKVEVAYSNQSAPFRVKFSVPLDQFNAYSAIFNTMLASFYPAS